MKFGSGWGSKARAARAQHGQKRSTARGTRATSGKREAIDTSGSTQRNVVKGMGAGKKHRQVMLLPVAYRGKEGRQGRIKTESNECTSRCMVKELQMEPKTIQEGTQRMIESVPGLNQEQKQAFYRMLLPPFQLDVPQKVEGSPFALGKNNIGSVIRTIFIQKEPLSYESTIMKALPEHRHWPELQTVAETMWNTTIQTDNEEGGAISDEKMEPETVVERDILPPLPPSLSFRSLVDSMAMKNKSKGHLTIDLELPEFTACTLVSSAHQENLLCTAGWDILANMMFSDLPMANAFNTELSNYLQVSYSELVESPNFAEVPYVQMPISDSKQGFLGLWRKGCNSVSQLNARPGLLDSKMFLKFEQPPTDRNETIHDLLSAGQEMRNDIWGGCPSEKNPIKAEDLLPSDRTMEEAMMIDPNDDVLLFPIPRLPSVDYGGNIATCLVQDSKLRSHNTQSYALYFDWSLLDPNFPLEASTKATYSQLFSPQLHPEPEVNGVDKTMLLWELVGPGSRTGNAAPSPICAIGEDLLQSKQAVSQESDEKVHKLEARPAALDELRFFKKLKDKEQPDRETQPPEGQGTKKNGLHTVTDVFSILPEAHRLILQQLLQESAGLAQALDQPVNIDTDIQSIGPQQLKRLEDRISNTKAGEIQPSNEVRQNDFHRLILVYVLYQAAACLLHYGIRAAHVYVSYNLKMIPPLSRFLEGKSVERLRDAQERVEHGELQDCSKLELLSKQLKEIYNSCPQPRVLLLIDNRAAFSVIDTIASAKFKPFILDKAELLLSDEEKPNEEQISNAVKHAMQEANCIVSTYCHLHRSFPYQTFDCIIQYVECPLGSSSPEAYKALEHAATDRIIFHMKTNIQDTGRPDHEAVPDCPSKTASAKYPSDPPAWRSTLVVNASENIELKRNKIAWQTVLLAERGHLKVVERKMTLVVDAAITPGACVVFKEATTFLRAPGNAEERMLELVTDVLLVVSFSFDTCLFFLDTRGVEASKWALIASMIHLAAESTQVQVQLFLCHNDSDVKRALNCLLSMPELWSKNSLILEDTESQAECFLNSCPSVNPLAAGTILKQFGSVGEMLGREWTQLASFCTSSGIPARSLNTLLQQLQSHVTVQPNQHRAECAETRGTYAALDNPNVEAGWATTDSANKHSEAGNSQGLQGLGAAVGQQAYPGAYIQRKRLQAPCTGTGLTNAPQKYQADAFLSGGEQLDRDGVLSQSTSTSTDPDDPALFEMPLKAKFTEPRVPTRPLQRQIQGWVGSACAKPSGLTPRLSEARHQSSTLGGHAWRDGQLPPASLGGPPNVHPNPSNSASFGTKTTTDRGKKRTAGPKIQNVFQVRAPKDVPRKRKAPRRSVGLSMKPLASTSLGQVSGGRTSTSSLQEFSFRNPTDNASFLPNGEAKQVIADGSLLASTQRASSSVQMDYTPPDKIAKRTLSFRSQKGCGGQSKLFWR